MTNLATDRDGSTPLENRDDLGADMLELASNLSSDCQQPLDLSVDRDDSIPQSSKLSSSAGERSASEIPTNTIVRILPDWQISNSNCDRDDMTGINSNANVESIDSDIEQLDVNTELDLLLTSLQLATPQPPTPASTSDPSSISHILDQISTAVPVTHIQESIQALNASRQQLAVAQTQLEVLAQRNQIQVDRVDANVLEVKQIKFRIQQLAQHSKNQIKNAEQILASLAEIRTEIVTSLDKFGGYDDIHGMLAQLEATRYALVIAHDRVTTGQEAFYDSLKVIQSQVATRSNESEAKLRDYQNFIQSISQTISTDRLRIAGMSVDMSTKFNELHGLSAQIAVMHGQIVEKSQTLQSKVTQIEQNFGLLSQSVQAEKEQFYELTVETIEKADLIRSQLAEIVQQISDDRVLFSTLTTEIESIRTETRAQSAQQLTNFELRDFELNSLFNNVKIDRKHQLITTKMLTNWLWILSGGMGIILVLLIRLSLAVK
jgi:hypothetical protein